VIKHFQFALHFISADLKDRRKTIVIAYCIIISMATLYVYNPLAFLDTNRDAAFILLGLCSAYSLAGCLMQHFVVFYAWQLIGRLNTTTNTDLQAIQHATGTRTLLLYVLPQTFTSVVTAYLTYTTGEWWLKWCCAFLTVSWVSSFTVQIPLQLQVQQRGDRAALRRLVLTNWVRVAAMIAHCAMVFQFCLSLFYFDMSNLDMGDFTT